MDGRALPRKCSYCGSSKLMKSNSLFKTHYCITCSECYTVLPCVDLEAPADDDAARLSEMLLDPEAGA